MDELFSKVDITRRRFVQQLTVGVFTSATLISFPRTAHAQVSIAPTSAVTPTPGLSVAPTPTPPLSSPPPPLPSGDQSAPLVARAKEKKKRVNRTGDPDYETSGNVVGIRFDPSDPVPGIVADMPALPFNVDDIPYVLIATADGIQMIRLGLVSAEARALLRVGVWAEFGGEKMHEHLFDATDIFEP